MHCLFSALLLQHNAWAVDITAEHTGYTDISVTAEHTDYIYITAEYTG
jgi:RNA:NAD 2'-phosphotransferase (TPT1/KptA family)